MAFQFGDIVNFSRLAWDVYRYGWSDDLNATRQYREFGADVNGLANSLDLLSRVVYNANVSFRNQLGYEAEVRWDPESLLEIIGDFNATLRECNQLIASNERYRLGSNPLQNLEWNILVQPIAESLRHRIAMHNSKIQLVLKPFEVDLLCRIHQDLANRMEAIHHDIRLIMGIFIPDLDSELRRQQEQSTTTLLEIPYEVSERFRYEANEGAHGAASPGLPELTHALVVHFEQSPVHFLPGIVVTDRYPPVEQFISLLKCVWILRVIKESVQLQQAHQESHWPRYVRQLETNISLQCERFGRDLIQPNIPFGSLGRGMFLIWPEQAPTRLVDIVTNDEMMELLFDQPLQSPAPNGEQNVRLLRRMGHNGRRFRAILTGTEPAGMGRPRQDTQIMDFDINTVVLSPHYALPSSGSIVREMILRPDERIARMLFLETKHILKFQQAITGWKVWKAYTKYNVEATFVTSDGRKPLVERACLQFWIPKATESTLITSKEAMGAAASVKSPRRNGSMASTATGFSSMAGTSPPYGGRGSVSSGVWNVGSGSVSSNTTRGTSYTMAGGLQSQNQNQNPASFQARAGGSGTDFRSRLGSTGYQPFNAPSSRQGSTSSASQYSQPSVSGSAPGHSSWGSATGSSAAAQQYSNPPMGSLGIPSTNRFSVGSSTGSGPQYAPPTLSRSPPTNQFAPSSSSSGAPQYNNQPSGSTTFFPSQQRLLSPEPMATPGPFSGARQQQQQHGFSGSQLPTPPDRYGPSLSPTSPNPYSSYSQSPGSSSNSNSTITNTNTNTTANRHRGSITTLNTTSPSIASDVSARSNSGSRLSVGSSGCSTAIDTGGHTTGVVHKRMPDPLLVLFTQNPLDGRLSYVTIPITQTLEPNPRLCDCPRSSPKGSACCIASMEPPEGTVRRYEANTPSQRSSSSYSNSNPYSGSSSGFNRGGDVDWNIAQLARSHPASTSDANLWRKLERVTLRFPDARSRAQFNGAPKPCGCKIRTNQQYNDCLLAGHRGLWGEVQDIQRQNTEAYNQAKQQMNTHVINGPM